MNEPTSHFVTGTRSLKKVKLRRFRGDTLLLPSHLLGEPKVLLVSSSRHPEQWIVPGGGMEPEEEPCGAAVREVYEEAGVKGKLGRLLGIFEHNQDRKHRTYVFTLIVTETLEDWEDSVNIGRKRKWFKVDEATRVLQSHKPVHAEYLRRLTTTCNPTCSPVCSPTNGNTPSSQVMDNNTPHYVVCSSKGSDLVNR
ncbi:nudix (nucleoside diphosphate linked moiety X)-type motif 4a isoform X1 [Micropterus dolomieu]|uniref:nudix (nucleoside diphosphate linked moiety X)-type motif 4a isoform X1 n=1 Tax=Micropterus dolomieu TaxID=147949 RepID=UPI001E8DA6F2|nr:nudix (nucleoside diphosphate linked moiety X)-type motif 4a isoform X1 [Micropterus dolomieu]